MAIIVSLQILVNDDCESRIADGLNEMLRSAAVPVDADDPGAPQWILDWRLADQRGNLFVDDVPESAVLALQDGAYEEGLAFVGIPVHVVGRELSQTFANQ